MSYRELVRYVALINPSTSVTALGSHLLVTTDPNMRFEIWEVMVETATVTGFTSGPTISIGTVATSFNDQIASLAISASTQHQMTLTSAGGANAKSIAPSTGIFVNVTTAAVATTYTLNIIIKGLYF